MNKKVLGLITLLFIISWAALAFFGVLLVQSRIESSRLENKAAFFKENSRLLAEQVKQCQKARAGNEEAVDYLEWQFVLKDQVVEAAKRLNREVDKIRGLKKNKELLSLLYYNLGLNYTLAVDFDAAIQTFEKAIKFQPNDAESYYNLGLLYSTYRQNPKQAIKYYKKYLELVPSGLKAGEVRERLDVLQKR